MQRRRRCFDFLLGEIEVDILVTPGRVTGSIGGARIDLAATPLDSPIQAIGFTAATGLERARHAVDNVRSETCP